MTYEVFTDGSYKEFADYGPFFSSAATITKEGDPSSITTLVKTSNDSDLISMRNVAGEIMAVMMVMEHCLNVLNLKQDDKVILHYDYVGIENWTAKRGDSNYWRAKNPVTQAYRDYINTIVRPRFAVEFVHTPGHTGVAGNERVDKLARDAIEKHVHNLRTGV